MSEQWKPIEGHPNYMVSSIGRVKSLDRTVKVGKYARRHVPECVLKPTIKKGIGYLAVMLDRRQHFVHTLVATAFLGQRPEGFQCAHNDGSRDNNDVTNLRWASASDNQADRISHGTSCRGRMNHNAKLSDHDILRIRSDSRTRVSVARDYGVTPEAISAIVHRKNWDWL